MMGSIKDMRMYVSNDDDFPNLTYKILEIFSSNLEDSADVCKKKKKKKKGKIHASIKILRMYQKVHYMITGT